MKVGIVSDTHGNIKNTQKAIKVLERERVEVVLHSGDVCGHEIVEMFAPWPTHFVAGNCDDREELGESVQAAGQHWHDLFGEIVLNDKKIALLHSHVPLALEQAIHSGKFDLVCYGHTHKKEIHKDNQTLVINPGAIHRANPHTIAVIDLESIKANHLLLD